VVVPIRPPNHNHKTFIGNSETCEVLQLAVNGVAPRTRVGVGKAWEMSNTKNKSKDSWLTGIAHHDGLVYCLQYDKSCIVVLDADNALKYKRKYDLPFPGPEGIAISGRYVYVTSGSGDIVRFTLPSEGSREGLTDPRSPKASAPNAVLRGTKEPNNA
jgi:hypothetical protein